MKYSEKGDRLQLAASIGVIIGLILVIYEIRENNRIAENQAAIDMNILYGEWTTVMTDKDMAELFVKSLENPDALTRVDLLRLHYAYSTAWQAFVTQHFLWQSGGLRMYPESTLYEDTSSTLSGPVARRYVLSGLGQDNSAIAEIMRQAPTDTQPDARLKYLDSLRPPPEGFEQPD
jgi:hypothetical protein